MPKVRDLGIDAYFRREEKREDKEKKRKLKAERAEQKRQEKIVRYGRESEIYKAQEKRSKAKKRAQKAGRTTFGGAPIRKKKQGGKLSSRMRIKLL